MNRSWLIALASTVLLAVAVALELRGLFSSDVDQAQRGAQSPRHASTGTLRSPVGGPQPTARIPHGRSPFQRISEVNRLPDMSAEELPLIWEPPALPANLGRPGSDTSLDAPEEVPGPGETPADGPEIDLSSHPDASAPVVRLPPPGEPESPREVTLFAPPSLPSDGELAPTVAVNPSQPPESPQSVQAAKSSPPESQRRVAETESSSRGSGPPVEDLPPGEPEAKPPAPPTRPEVAWWAPLVPQPQREESDARPLAVATLIQETVLHSEHVQAVSLQAQVAETEIVQADAAFDPASFIDSRWIDASDPVGNLLTTGGPPRLTREEWSSSIGFRRKTRSGGAFEIAQRLVQEDNNSVFFVPANQATSRLTVSLNQPLLKGGGRAFNRSLVLLAMHDTQIARDRFRSELEAQVLRVVREYWELYLQRSVLLQQRSALRQAEEILEEIRARASFDSLESQVQRVRATVAIRNAHIVRAQAAVRNAESRLRALSNSPLLGGEGVELLPIEPPLRERIDLPVRDARTIALSNRTEVDAALTRVRVAGVELGMSENELLPTLGLVLETYISGLAGNFNLAESVGAQFSEGAPSYTAGLLFEMPLGRRRAKALYQQKVLELRQAEHLFRDTIATLSSEVEIALREVDTTWQELVARRESAEATRAEVDYLRARLDHIPGEDNRAVSFLLEELLNAIDRLVRDESELAAAQRNYAVSIAEFYRATGMLVAVEAPTM